jgi:hypothetical protein
MAETIVFTNNKITNKMSKIDIDNEFNELKNQHVLKGPKISSENLTIEEIIKESKVEYSEKLEPPPVCLEIIKDNKNSIIGTMGTFSVVMGKAKSRKTFLTSMLVSAMLKKIQDATEMIKGTLPTDRNKVIFFDTEQSRHKVQQIQNRILKLAESTPTENLSIYCLRPYQPKQRVETIRDLIYNTPGLGMIVIDGIRDLTFDINSPQEAVETTGLLMKWTYDLNIHCICVIHQNKGDNNARGHLGTELINKGDTIISVTKQDDDKELSIVEPVYCREKEFEPFAFKIDETDLPYIFEDWRSRSNDGKKKSLSPHDIEIETHKKQIEQIFENQSNFKYTDLMRMIKTIFNKNGVSLGDNKAKDYISFYQNEKFIIKKEPNKTIGEKYPFYEKNY